MIGAFRRLNGTREVATSRGEKVLMDYLMRRIAILGLVGALVAASPAAAADAPPATTTPAPTTTTPPPAPKPTAHFSTLSNRTTFTRWAYTNLTLKAKSKPGGKGATVGKLHFNTEDGRPEIYLALQLYTDVKGNEWVQTQLPGRPNGRTGWVPREALGELHLIHTQVVVDRSKLRISLYKNGKKVFQAPIGVGKGSTPTPGGHSWIREKLNGFGNAVYGPLAFGTGTYSDKLTDWPGGGVVGIHGTNEPNLIPGRPSHGCIRLKNASILKLSRLMKPGTPLLIK
jgi:lipoprotein-anchoring transpeptidase ErfK/SrfK